MQPILTVKINTEHCSKKIVKKVKILYLKTLIWQNIHLILYASRKVVLSYSFTFQKATVSHMLTFLVSTTSYVISVEKALPAAVYRSII